GATKRKAKPKGQNQASNAAQRSRRRRWCSVDTSPARFKGHPRAMPSHLSKELPNVIGLAEAFLRRRRCWTRTREDRAEQRRILCIGVRFPDHGFWTLMHGLPLPRGAPVRAGYGVPIMSAEKGLDTHGLPRIGF